MSRFADRNRAAERRADQQASRSAAKSAWQQRKGAQLAAGEVVIYSDTLRVGLRARLDDGYSHPEGGYGGWEEEGRPGQVSATVFRGGPPRRLPIKVRLGGWPVSRHPLGDTCAQQIRQLTDLGAQDEDARRGHRPPLVRVRGNVPHRGEQWFIDDVQWSTETGHTVVVAGNVVAARCTVILKLFVPIDLVVIDAAKRKGAQNARRYQVTQADVDSKSPLQRIAHDQLDTRNSTQNRAAVRDIQKLNDGIRDPKRVRAGQWIKLPSTASIGKAVPA